MSYNTLNHEKQGGSTWVIGGELNIASGVTVTVGTSNPASIPVVTSTSNDAPIPNFGVCIIRNAAATANDCRTIAAPTQAGLVLHLVANCAATGVNVCAASATDLVDIIIRDQAGSEDPIWQLAKASTQKVTLISANTSEWYVSGPVAGTFSTDGST